VSNNSVIPVYRPSPNQLADALGVTQFSGESNWAQVIGGLIIQGGKVSGVPAEGSVTVFFDPAFPKQLLGVFLQSIYSSPTAGNENSGCVSTPTLVDFILLNDGLEKDFYWWAIGV
jgi:hypothetical protein